MIRTKAKGYIYGIALSVLILVLMAANLWFGSINIPAGAVWNTLIGNEVEKPAGLYYLGVPSAASRHGITMWCRTRSFGTDATNGIQQPTGRSIHPGH